MNKKNKKIVTIGGGTGTYTVLSSLKNKGFELSAVVSMCDDGGSTGRLRDDYGVLPAGDVRRSLIALAGDESKARDLFEYRFDEGELAGHNFGNIFLAAVEKVSGNFYDAVKTAGVVLNIQGKVYPVTLDNVRLHAELEDGSIISGETNIDIPKHNPTLRIKRIFTEPQNPKPNLDALVAIKEADAVIIGPGDLYTSVLPNFLVDGVVDALKKSKAKKIYVCNLTTKPGETSNFSLKDFVAEVENYIGESVLDFILVNNQKPQKELLRHYEKYNSQIVLASEDFKHPGLYATDFVQNKELIRHDKEKLARAIIEILEN